MASPRRYYVRSPDGKAIAGYDNLESAKHVALEYGAGAQLVDTLAQAYYPMVQEVADGEIRYAGYGGWDTGRLGLDRDLIEGIKKGHPAIAHAFLAKGADPNAKDKNGGPALLWAVASGKAETVKLLLDYGADVGAKDHQGMTPLRLAKEKNRPKMIDILVAAGASE